MDRRQLLMLMGLIGVVAGLVVWGVKDSQNRQELKRYTKEDINRPRLVVKERFKDMGEMRLQETRSTEFVLKNEGNKDLQVYYGSTNCGCTFGQVITAGKKSPVFGMHSNQKFLVSVPPGEEFVVRAIYKPFLMPVKGPVQRAVYIKTNDPDNPQVEFVVGAVVR